MSIQGYIGEPSLLQRYATATNLSVGSQGIAGSLNVYPGTAGTGKLLVQSTAYAGDYTMTITNASQAAARTYTIPDAGASASFMLTGSASQTMSGPLVISSASSGALVVGPNGSTNPALKVDDSTSSAATGIKLTPAAAASGMAISTISSGTNEGLTIDAKGSGTLTLGPTQTGNVLIGPAAGTGPALVLEKSSNQLVFAPSGTANTITLTAAAAAAARTYTLRDEGQSGSFMVDNSGSAVTQLTSNATGVTLNSRGGKITMFGALAGNANATFTLTNSYITATSQVLAWVSNTVAATSFAGVKVTIAAPGSGTVAITVTNADTGANSQGSAAIVQFIVI